MIEGLIRGTGVGVGSSVGAWVTVGVEVEVEVEVEVGIEVGIGAEVWDSIGSNVDVTTVGPPGIAIFVANSNPGIPPLITSKGGVQEDNNSTIRIVVRLKKFIRQL